MTDTKLHVPEDKDVMTKTNMHGKMLMLKTRLTANDPMMAIDTVVSIEHTRQIESTAVTCIGDASMCVRLFV